ncbi:isocitrate lyase/PEP mutase family protein [Aquabacter sp. CN5-332]|uniref:isocitrate lyase/PEP mutase family protein n=1 Tax=Aquabacter sp. CN5-332 TaxID=3156608 RepID=UPI0032B5E8A6
MSKTRQLRELIAAGEFLHMPSVHDGLGGRAVEAAGFKAAFVGGYVTGASRAVSEPLLTMTEQVETAANVAERISIPVVVDAGAGWGDALHTMRTVREFARAGIAGLHLEDQLFPKRAHYHKYVAHAIPVEEYVEKIDYACRERAKVDPDFVIIARTDTCRFYGVEEAVMRINKAAEVGADMGLLFPRNSDEARRAPKMAAVPLIYVQSLGNRDGRPVFSRKELQEMGYAGCIEAQFAMLHAFFHMEKALRELAESGRYDQLTPEQYVQCRQGIEDAIGLDEYYEIEESTVETRRAV